MYIQTHINQHVFTTKVLQTKREITTGMMGKKFEEKFEALLFVINKPESTFWMKKCIIPLDIIFIQNGKINKIFHNCPPCKKDDECKQMIGQGELVLEIPGGLCKKLHIKRGAKIEFTKI
jgi:hypothetical protein